MKKKLNKRIMDFPLNLFMTTGRWLAMVILIQVCVVMSGCRTGKDAVTPEKIARTIAKAQADSLKYEKAKAAFLSGNFVLQISRIAVEGFAEVPTDVGLNYLEISDNKCVFQYKEGLITGDVRKRPRRTAGKLRRVKIKTDKKNRNIYLEGSPSSPCSLSYINLTLYPESDEVFGALMDRANHEFRLNIYVKGHIVPVTEANVGRGQSSAGEELNVL